MTRFLLLLVSAVLAVGGTVQSAVAGDLHPQDGPHVDVRLFVEEQQVVVRLEMNLVFLDHMVDFPRENSDRISTSEWKDLPGLLEAFFAVEHAVIIDGVRATPSFERLQINNPDLRLLPLFPVSGERGLRKIRFELVYPVARPPVSVRFDWSTYPPNILVDPDDPPPLAIAAELDAEGVRIPLVFSEGEPTHDWYASGATIEDRLLAVAPPVRSEGHVVPVLAIALFVLGGCVVVAGVLSARILGSSTPILVSIVVEGPFLAGAVAAMLFGVGTMTIGAGPVLPDRSSAEDVFRPLHANVYRAFDFVSETDVYDALAWSAEGDLLDRLYRIIHRGLVMQEEGGAVARVSEVRPLEIEVDSIRIAADEEGVERPMFDVTCRWQVDGVVSHWGHAHRRTNEYLAAWTVAAFEDGWRFTRAEILEQDRVDGEDDAREGMSDHDFESFDSEETFDEFEV